MLPDPLTGVRGGGAERSQMTTGHEHTQGVHIVSIITTLGSEFAPCLRAQTWPQRQYDQ